MSIISYDTNDSKIEYYRNNYWNIINIDKPLKGITSYTKDNLFTIINKLDIRDMTLKNTKNELYQKILEKL